MVDQVCAKQKRKMIRVQINPETDEMDLIGGFQLIEGNTIFVKGPVIRAMEDGALLLIDEIDRGSNRLMCLQGVLEGTPYLIKKTNELVRPAPGFNVIATANTKGQGDDTGKFIAATIIDEAFLERFVVTVCQEYAPEKVELDILTKVMGDSPVDGAIPFVETLVKWAGLIRESYADEAITEVISTRRLCHIVKTFKIFQSSNINASKKKAITMCINRFDEEIRTTFYEFYIRLDNLEEKKVAKTKRPTEENVDPIVTKKNKATTKSTKCPF